MTIFHAILFCYCGSLFLALIVFTFYLDLQVFRHLSGNTSPTTRSSLERYAADVAFETAFRSPAVAPISLNNNSFGLATGGAPGQGLAPLSKSPTPGDLGAKDQKNVEIAEVIVGAILGNLFVRLFLKIKQVALLTFELE